MRPKRKKLKPLHIAIAIALWVAMVGYILMYTKKIDGPIVLTILMSGAFIGVAIYNNSKKKSP